MNTIKKYIYTLLAVVACSVALSSCIDDLDTMPLDDNQLVSDQVYNTEEGYIGVLAKCYSSLVLTGQKGGDGGDGDLQGANEGYSSYVRLLFYMQELCTDNFLMPSSSNGLRKCLNLTWDASNASVITWTYQRLYMAIAYSNEFLRECTEGKLQERGLWDAMKDDYKAYRAEARFIRAYCYSMLCDFFGSVPYVDENTGVKDLPVQWSRKEIFNYAANELKAIIGETESTDLLNEPKQSLYGHVDKVAAWFLLSRMYLNAEVWIGEDGYQNAYEYAKKVISSNAYPLASDYRHIFLADNDNCPEIIWPLVQDGLMAQSSAGTNFYVKAFVNGPMNELYQTGVGSKGWGNVRAKTTLVDVFDESDIYFDKNDTWGNNKNDKRAQFMTALDNQTKNTWDDNEAMTSLFTCGYGYIKWRNVTKEDELHPSGDTYVSIDFPMFRTADAYLMAAEAILRGASGSRAEALDYVNEIRMRAYMSDKYAVPYAKSDVSGKILDKELTLDFILDERQRELASEVVRRTDLIRFNKFTKGHNWDWKNEQRLGADVADHFKLFPIPETERTNNPSIVQNDGYASSIN